MSRALRSQSLYQRRSRNALPFLWCTPTQCPSHESMTVWTHRAISPHESSALDREAQAWRSFPTHNFAFSHFHAATGPPNGRTERRFARCEETSCLGHRKNRTQEGHFGVRPGPLAGSEGFGTTTFPSLGTVRQICRGIAPIVSRPSGSLDFSSALIVYLGTACEGRNPAMTQVSSCLTILPRNLWRPVAAPSPLGLRSPRPAQRDKMTLSSVWSTSFFGETRRITSPGKRRRAIASLDRGSPALS